MRKLGQTLAAIFVNVCLILLGYGANGSLEFDLTVSQAQGMYYQSIIIPGVLSLIMFALLFFIYPLNKKKVIELQDAKKQMYLEDGEEVAPSNN
jgi:GPH family glycoside/pentoside/hexuronide:cation symporter